MDSVCSGGMVPLEVVDGVVGRGVGRRVRRYGLFISSAQVYQLHTSYPGKESARGKFEERRSAGKIQDEKEGKKELGYVLLSKSKSNKHP